MLKIPSVLIRVIMEYEKETITTSYPDEALSLASTSQGTSSPKSSWSTDFENLFTSHSNSDICFIVADQEIKAHKAILSARSPVFAAMFDSDMKEKDMDRIDIPDIAPDIFNEFLRFIYTDQVKLTEGNVEPLLAASDKYLLVTLKCKCEEFIIKRLTIENCIELLTLADRHNAPHLKRMATEFFRSRRNEIWKTESWITMKTSHPDDAFDVVERFLLQKFD